VRKRDRRKGRSDYRRYRRGRREAKWYHFTDNKAGLDLDIKDSSVVQLPSVEKAHSVLEGRVITRYGKRI
jgi:flavin reductase (DIM6/NTAB) family NADH-FMN oxidoreductase RutF